MKPATLNLDIATGITFGPVVMTMLDDDDLPVDLAGWSVWSQARIHGTVLDLLPTITNAAAGEVTIEMSDEQTAPLTPAKMFWDIILENPTGEKLGPYLAGTLTITATQTKP